MVDRRFYSYFAESIQTVVKRFIGMRKIWSAGLFLLCLTQTVLAQTGNTDPVNTIMTAVPFLRIAPDARAGAMGDIGVASEADANSIHWNAAKYSFAEKSSGLSFSYTPWLQQLVSDIYIVNTAGYKQLSDKQTLGASLTLFNLGSIQFTDIQGLDAGSFNPRELNVDVAIANKLSDNFSMSLALRYIYSNLASGQQSAGNLIRPGHAFGADIGAFYNKELEVSGYDSKLAFGMNISNIGTKISYTRNTDRDFIPMNLGLGGSFTLNVDQYNKISFVADLNKLLVPTPQEGDLNNDGILDYKQVSVPEGLFGSFADAPRGFAEEMEEIIWSVGAEYWYADQFAVRAGYFHEAATKGNRKFLSAGVGLRFNVVGIDAAYLVPTNSQQSPLEQTYRFTLTFDFDSAASGTATEEK